MTTNDLAGAIFRAMLRDPGVVRPSHISLKDGTEFRGMPFSLQLGRTKKAVEVQFVVDGESSPRVVQLDEISPVA